MPVISALWEVKAGRLLEPRSLRSAWATWQNLISTKNANIFQALWCTRTVPATQEAENLALSPRLECNGRISARYNFRLLGSSNSWTGFHHVGQVGLELLTSGDLSALASQSAEITGLTLSPSDMISAHYSLNLPGSSDPPTSASQVAGLQTGVLLCSPGWSQTPGSSDLPALASQSAEITGMSHCTWPRAVLKSRYAKQPKDVFKEAKEKQKPPLRAVCSSRLSWFFTRMDQNPGNPIPESDRLWQLTEALRPSLAARLGSSLKEKMPLLKVAVGVDANN
ncbi:hypothetical protein AAY473_023759 [Plecturocebus cupreus]